MTDGAPSRSDAARPGRARKARAAKPIAERQEASSARGLVVPFLPVSAGFRRRVAADEPRGEILLFTGVRYERPDASVAATRTPRRRTEGLRQPQS